MELEQIKNSILEIRGKKVILDFELAKMYQVETKYLKRTVRNNLKRFPSGFMFELSPKEWNNLRCNFSTSKNVGGIRYLPFAFTEQGVAMLSGLLNSNVAIERNEYKYHASLCNDAPICINIPRTIRKTHRTRKAAQSKV